MKMTTKIMCETKGGAKGPVGYDTRDIYRSTSGQENKDESMKRESRWFWLYEFSTVDASMCSFLWLHKETIVWLAGEVTLSLHTPIILAT